MTVHGEQRSGVDRPGRREDVDCLLDTIDGALEDATVSVDAMRWTPELPDDGVHLDWGTRCSLPARDGTICGGDLAVDESGSLVRCHRCGAIGVTVPSATTIGHVVFSADFDLDDSR